jgi:hypothetical protein
MEKRQVRSKSDPKNGTSKCMFFFRMFVCFFLCRICGLYITPPIENIHVMLVGLSWINARGPE